MRRFKQGTALSFKISSKFRYSAHCRRDHQVGYLNALWPLRFWHPLFLYPRHLSGISLGECGLLNRMSGRGATLPWFSSVASVIDHMSLCGSVGPTPRGWWSSFWCGLLLSKSSVVAEHFQISGSLDQGLSFLKPSCSRFFWAHNSNTRV